MLNGSLNHASCMPPVPPPLLPVSGPCVIEKKFLASLFGLAIRLQAQPVFYMKSLYFYPEKGNCKERDNSIDRYSYSLYNVRKRLSSSILAFVF